METKKERPAMPEQIRGEVSLVMQNKDTENLSNRQRKVVKLLSTGKYSAADISIELHFSDPRSYIRELRNKGLNIEDEWVTYEGVRFKRYWITPEKPQGYGRK